LQAWTTALDRTSYNRRGGKTLKISPRHSTQLEERKRRRKEMKFMTTWALIPGTVQEAVDRFLAGEAAPQEGVTLLGRWHNVDCSGGFSLYETNDPAALHKGAARWADLLELNTVAVIEDAQAGPNLTEIFKK
jgi:hypothetical protein